MDGVGHARRGGFSIQPALDTLWWETSHVAETLDDLPFFCAVRPVICLDRGSTPPQGVYADGIAIIRATHLRRLLRGQTPILTGDQVTIVAQRLRERLPAAN